MVASVSPISIVFFVGIVLVVDVPLVPVAVVAAVVEKSVVIVSIFLRCLLYTSDAADE